MLSRFVVSALAVSFASAQTFSACNPTKKTGCPNPQAFGGKVTIDFTQGESDLIYPAAGTTITYDKELGAEFSIAAYTDAPTVSTHSYIFFGKVDIVTRAAPGQGIVSSFVLQSDDLDEVDWEWLGSDNTQVQTNYFSKGCTDTYTRGGYSAVTNPQGEFTKYTIDWSPNKLVWLINDQVVRTLEAANAQGCDGFPQTPMQIKLGTWGGGAPTQPQGTIEWAGGPIDLSKGPFVAYYKSLTVEDYMGGKGAKSAKEYQYTDMSGSADSIKIIAGDGSSSGGSSSSKTSTSTSTATKSSSDSDATTMSTVSSSSATPTSSNTTTTGGSGSGSNPTGGSAATSDLAEAGAFKTSFNAAMLGASALVAFLVL